jgi:cysteine desulfurase
MADKRIYLDYNATTPLDAEVKAQMIKDLEIYGNASSMHSDGREANARLIDARMKVGALIGLEDSAEITRSVTFTSGGSESNNTVFLSAEEYIRKNPNGKNEIITTAIEHPCVLNSAAFLKEKGFKVTFLPVNAEGKIKMDAYAKALNDKTLLVSVMFANNEIGTIQDIPEITRLAKSFGAFVHTDAVQAAGKVPVDVGELGIDYLTMSAHKIYGPKGIGALYHRPGAPLFPLIHGGHQEDGLRAGTYNNLAIFGFGLAAELAKKNLPLYISQTSGLRDRLKNLILERIPNIKVNGHPLDNIPNTLNISFPGAEGESILLSLDLAGIEVSTGSACASGSLDPSHVLMATGVWPELAHGSIRFSLGLPTTAAEIDFIADTLPPIIKRLRAMSTVAS